MIIFGKPQPPPQQQQQMPSQQQQQEMPSQQQQQQMPPPQEKVEINAILRVTANGVLYIQIVENVRKEE